MNSKQVFLNKIKVLIDENPNDKSLSKKFLKFLIIESVITLICFASFLILSLVLINNVNKLAIVTPKIYILFTAILLGISLIFTSLFAFLYCFSKDLPKVKFLYAFYQVYDMIMFVFEILVVLYFVVMFILTPAKVSGDSMESTYHDGDTVLVWHLFYEPKIDDVIIIDTEESKYNTNRDTEFIIKRVVAKEGSIATYENGFLVVDGEKVESMTEREYMNLFINSETGESYYSTGNITIPEGYLIVLGDNREESYDSTEFGLVKDSDVLGVTIIRLYPNFGNPEKNIR